jgi:predicted acylesterase/phospholipase RssA
MCDFDATLRDTEYVAFAGCGTRAALYLGFVHALQGWSGYYAMHRRIRGCIGTSSGSLTALGMLLGMPAIEMLETAMQSVGDASGIASGVDVTQLIQQYGLDDGSVLRDVIVSTMRSMGLEEGVTFEALHRITGKEFAVCVTNMRTAASEVFTHRNRPTMRVADAVYASMTVPFVFVPLVIDGDVYCDGGLTFNTPFHHFPGDRTLVVTLESSRSTSISGIKSFAIATATCIITSQHAALNIHRDLHPSRVVSMSGNDVLDDRAITLSVDPMQIGRQFRSGYAAATRMLRPELAIALGTIARHCATVPVAERTVATDVPTST